MILKNLSKKKGMMILKNLPKKKGIGKGPEMV
jgi:hypothetical protein